MGGLGHSGPREGRFQVIFLVFGHSPYPRTCPASYGGRFSLSDSYEQVSYCISGMEGARWTAKSIGQATWWWWWWWWSYSWVVRCLPQLRSACPLLGANNKTYDADGASALMGLGRRRTHVDWTRSQMRLLINERRMSSQPAMHRLTDNKRTLPWSKQRPSRPGAPF